MVLEYILIGYLIAAAAFFFFIAKDVQGGLNLRIVTFFLVLSLVWPIVILVYYLLDGMNS